MYCVIASDQMRTLLYLIVEGTFGANSVNNLVTLLRFLTPPILRLQDILYLVEKNEKYSDDT